MTGLDVETRPLIRAIRAAADVVDVDAGERVLASVLVVPGHIAVARLGRSLEGSPHEGAVLRAIMLTTAGLHGCGLFVWLLGDE